MLTVAEVERLGGVHAELLHVIVKVVAPLMVMAGGVAGCVQVEPTPFHVKVVIAEDGFEAKVQESPAALESAVTFQFKVTMLPFLTRLTAVRVLVSKVETVGVVIVGGL